MTRVQMSSEPLQIRHIHQRGPYERIMDRRRERVAMSDPKFGAKPEKKKESAPNPALASLFIFGAAVGGLGAFLPKAKPYWVIQRPDGSFLLYKSGTRKGRPKLFSSQEKAERTLSKLPEQFQDAIVRKA